jgi:serine/threonine protein kinase
VRRPFLRDGNGIRWGHNEDCAKHRSSVRGLVMEKYTTLENVFRQRYDHSIDRVHVVIDYAIETILRLRELHDAGFIHGGINAETVALRDSDSRIVLVDFAHARFYPSEIGGVDKVAHAIGQLDLISKLNESYWSMMGLRIGRRDDLYRVIEMIAYLLTPTKHEFFDALLSLRSSKKSMAEVKSTASFFSMKYPHKSLCELNASKDKMPQCDNAMLELKKVLAIVRRISSVDTEPNYRSIIEGLEAAREALGS